MTKYYQLTHNDESVGVIKVVNGVVPHDNIKEAIEQHVGHPVNVTGVEFFDDDYAFEIGYESGELTGTVFGERTWLYF